MNRLRPLLAPLALLALFAFVLADEPPIDPIPIGGGQTSTQQVNGQSLQISASGISATVYLDECSSARVRGTVVRTSGGTSSGTVTITWVNNSGRSVQLRLDRINPEDPFSMEGGEGDKRSGEVDN